MSLIAGIVCRSDRSLPEAACADLERSMSRNSTHRIRVFRDRRSYFAKIDFGTFGEEGVFQDPTGALSVLAGEPLLSPKKQFSGTTRTRDLEAIHNGLEKNNWNVLKEANGTFNLVHYQPNLETVTLIVDKLGLRPLYYWCDDHVVVFAGALRILEACSLIRRKMDLRAATELVALGFPLADRTPYAGISALEAGAVIQINNHTISKKRYWRWDEVEASDELETPRLKTVYDSFRAAVVSRLGKDQATAAYLSGGLDSRCLVAVLRDLGLKVHSLNFARPGTQDYVFGNDFACRIGSIHQSLPRQRGDSRPDYSKLMADALGAATEYSADRPRLVWSGEGGSVLLGCVHLNEPIVRLMRAGKVDGAIDVYLQNEEVDIPDKLFRSKILGQMRDLLKQGIREELDKFHAEDAARNFYLFLMQNDQRRKLAEHFENLDLHGLEFQLPFFDGSFLELLVASPIDWYLQHRFYNKWLSQFPPEVMSVPWQTYPGHEPCPLPIATSLAYQWDDGYQAHDMAARKRHEEKQVFELLSSADFPKQILSRRNLRVAAWIHWMGWRDYGYVIEAAQTYRRYANKCNGEFIL